MLMWLSHGHPLIYTVQGQQREAGRFCRKGKVLVHWNQEELESVLHGGLFMHMLKFNGEIDSSNEASFKYTVLVFHVRVYSALNLSIIPFAEQRHHCYRDLMNESKQRPFLVLLVCFWCVPAFIKKMISPTMNPKNLTFSSNYDE